jgi:iron(III) transport system permease protein
VSGKVALAEMAMSRLSIGRIGGKTICFALVTGLIAYLTIPPVATVLVASLQSDFLSPSAHWTLQSYADMVSSAANYRMLLNSLVYAAGTTFFTTAIGAFLAWLCMRTDVPLRKFIALTAVLPFVIPGLLNAFAYVFLMSPQIGLLNHVAQSAFGVRPFSIYSLPGMILVQTLHLTPLAFGMLAGVFGAMDSTLEESARTSGASPLQVMRTITIPLAIPGFLSAALLIFVDSIAGFEVANLIGVPGHIFVFVSTIYDALKGYPTDYSGAAALSTVVMAISIVGIALSNRSNRRSSRFVTVSGKGFRARRAKLGRWRYLALALVFVHFLFAVLLPLAMLLWVSLLPGYEMPSPAALGKLGFGNYVAMIRYPRIVSGLVNSITVTVVAAALVMSVTTIAAYISVKTKFRAKPLLDTLIFLPIAIPGTILGVAVLFWYLMLPLPFDVYGTLAILVIGFFTLYLPHGMRFMSPAMMQIGGELEEAAQASGAGWVTILGRIYWPLLTWPFIGGFLFIVILAFREISAAVFLYAQGTEVFSVVLYGLWGEGLYGNVSALGIMMILAFAALATVARSLLGRKLPVRP